MVWGVLSSWSPDLSWQVVAAVAVALLLVALLVLELVSPWLETR